MPLHRLTVPVYFGGLPVTHDYINDPAANGDPGAPAPADVKKTSGVNEGTYFVAFGEPGTSSNTNRGMQALSENTDYLDDIVHRDLATPTITATATAVGVVTSAVLIGDIFVGAPGATNDQRTRTGLVSVVDADGLPVLSFDGLNYTAVLVSLIHDGASTNVIGSSYYTNPTVNFTPGIPNAQNYRLSYYERDALVEQDESVFTRYRNGVNGFATLWAYARDTRDGLVTFTGDKGFNDEVTFADLATFNALSVFNDVATFNDTIVLGSATTTLPKISADIVPAVGHYFLLQQFRYKTGPSVYVRLYTGNEPPGVADRGLAVSNNASYDPGTGLWTADDTTAPASLSTFSNEGYVVLTKTPTTVPWAANAWNVTSGTSVGTAWSGIGIYVRSILGAGLIEQQGGGFPAIASFLQSDDAAGYNDHYVPILGTANSRTTGTENGAGRVYLAAGGGGASPATFPGLVITHNAYWVPATREWQSDDTDSTATMIVIRGGVTFKFRATPGATWDDTDWSEFTDSSDEGDLTVAGSVRAENDVRATNDVVAGDDVVSVNGNLRADNGDAVADSFLYNSPASRRVTIPLDEGSVIPIGASYWAGGASAGYWELFGSTGSVLSFPFRVPKNYEVTEVRALVNKAGGGGDPDISMSWYRFQGIVWTYSSEVSATASLIDSDTTATENLEALIATGTPTLDTDSGWYVVIIPGTFVGDRVYAVSYVYTDIGPQNF